jgi:hypothetical protein
MPMLSFSHTGRRLPLLLTMLLGSQFLLLTPAWAQYKGGRVTNGFVEQRGWEAGYIRGCPNLSHFHWEPVTTILQAPVVIPVGTTTVRGDTNPVILNRPPIETPYAAGKPVTPNIQYTHTPNVKPDRLSPGVVPGGPGSMLGGKLLPHNNNNDLAGRLLPRHYIKPIHAPLPMKLPSDGSGDCHGVLASRDLNGQLLNPPKALSAEPKALSYGSYGNASGYRSSGARAEVSGRLASPQRRSLLASP